MDERQKLSQLRFRLTLAFIALSVAIIVALSLIYPDFGATVVFIISLIASLLIGAAVSTVFDYTMDSLYRLEPRGKPKRFSSVVSFIIMYSVCVLSAWLLIF